MVNCFFFESFWVIELGVHNRMLQANLSFKVFNETNACSSGVIEV
jgi:hypothetical protein